ncbi:MAG: hypothetical protein ACK5L3_11345 [Oscillospiraceae bacterium]
MLWYGQKFFCLSIAWLQHQINPVKNGLKAMFAKRRPKAAWENLKSIFYRKKQRTAVFLNDPAHKAAHIQ